MINFKYVRIQGKELAKNTMYAKGIFSMCWQLARQDAMSKDDMELFQAINGWFAEHLPWPPQCEKQEAVVCWFKAENADEMLERIIPAMSLLDRYDHPYYLVFTNSPGEIVYEDTYQIAAKVDGYLRIEEVQPSWSPKKG